MSDSKDLKTFVITPLLRTQNTDMTEDVSSQFSHQSDSKRA